MPAARFISPPTSSPNLQDEKIKINIYMNRKFKLENNMQEKQAAELSQFLFKMNGHEFQENSTSHKYETATNPWS